MEQLWETLICDDSEWELAKDGVVNDLISSVTYTDDAKCNAIPHHHEGGQSYNHRPFERTRCDRHAERSKQPTGAGLNPGYAWRSDIDVDFMVPNANFHSDKGNTCRFGAYDGDGGQAGKR